MVRPATIDDLAPCIELLGLLFSQEHEFNPNPSVQKRGLEMIIKNPEVGTVFVYERYGVIKGMVVILYTVSTALGEKVALLEDLVVLPNSRGNGIGTSLINYAVGFAINNGCGRITLLTDNDNESAHKLYRRQGFAKSDMVVFRKLIGEDNTK
ncbi:MAG TPA: GNAT family N-acetyltransferase [Nitrospiraceae bacterium]|nr:GNAT family N-acetyltransferase [Nitrospiraceae bacterium]